MFERKGKKTSEKKINIKWHESEAQKLVNLMEGSLAS